MIIEDIMKKNVITLSPLDTIQSAVEKMNEHHIRHIPIIEQNKRLIGIISDRDIRDVRASIFHHEDHFEDLLKPIQTIMTTNVITAHPRDFIEEAAVNFFEHKIGCLPIEKDGQLVGIVTETDVLHSLVTLLGVNQPCSHIEVKVPDQAGMLAEVSNIFKRYHVNIISVFVHPKREGNYKILVFRVQTMNTLQIVSQIKKEGYTVVWPKVQEFFS